MINKNLILKKEVELYHKIYENDLSSAISFLILNNYNLKSYFPSVNNDDYTEYELLWDLEVEKKYAVLARSDLEDKIRENDYIEMYLNGKLNEIYKDTRKEILEYSDGTISSFHFKKYFENNVPTECPFSFEYILDTKSYNYT